MPHVVGSHHGRGRWATLVLAVALLTAATVGRHPPVGSIAGTVRDKAGTPIANAQVLVVGTAHIALSDRAGRYRLADVPVGIYSVRARFIGYRSTELDKVAVRANQTTPVDLVLEPTRTELQEITPTSQTDRLQPRTSAPATP
jgi:carboxypeptidase family protein